MNILVLIRQLDQTPLQREVRNGGVHGDIITYYNETGDLYNLVVDGVEYSCVVQVCLISKESSYYLYIQYGETPNLVKMNISEIENISV